MLAITRRKVIKDLLQEHKSVTITDLAARLDVTKETIRRDLRAMERDNELRIIRYEIFNYYSSI